MLKTKKNSVYLYRVYIVQYTRQSTKNRLIGFWLCEYVFFAAFLPLDRCTLLKVNKRLKQSAKNWHSPKSKKSFQFFVFFCAFCLNCDSKIACRLKLAEETCWAIYKYCFKVYKINNNKPNKNKEQRRRALKEQQQKKTSNVCQFTEIHSKKKPKTKFERSHHNTQNTSITIYKCKARKNKIVYQYTNEFSVHVF